MSIHAEIDYNDRVLIVTFNYYPGSRGSYSEPPEPGELDILTVKENGQVIRDYDTVDIETLCYKSMSSNEEDI